MMTRGKAEQIVDFLIADICARKGIGNEWEAIDEDIQSEIRETWIWIVETGKYRP
jgi:hypothetical protein